MKAHALVELECGMGCSRCGGDTIEALAKSCPSISDGEIYARAATIDVDQFVWAPRPVRLQLRRVSGFNLQTLSRSINGLPAFNCARPGPLGNPFHHASDGTKHTPEIATRMFRASLLRDGFFYNEAGNIIWARDVQRILQRRNGACFCKPKAKWCHVDTLLEVANS